MKKVATPLVVDAAGADTRPGSPKYGVTNMITPGLNDERTD